MVEYPARRCTDGDYNDGVAYASKKSQSLLSNGLLELRHRIPASLARAGTALRDGRKNSLCQ